MNTDHSQPALPASQPDQLLSRSQFQARFDAVLVEIYRKAGHQARTIDPLYGDLVSAMGDFIRRGGKRLRPYLTYLAYHGYGGRDETAIINLSAALELFHNFTLIHDDIIDQDYVRYGGANIAGHYRESLAAKLPLREANRLADGMALLAGDLNIALAYQIIFDAPIPVDRRLAAARRASQMIFEGVGGEVLDVLIPTLGLQDVDQERLLRVCHYKTAAHTFEAPLQIGAIVAGADEELSKLSRVAIPVGVAFQLVDDLLGLFGNENELGKPVLSDLREGKHTVLMVAGLERATRSDQTFLASALGNPKAGYRHLRQVRSILEQCGARALTQDLARRQVEEASRHIDELKLSDEARASLLDLAKLSIARHS